MATRQSVRGTVRGMGARANPAFAAGAVAVPLVALAGAIASGGRLELTYVHVMAGVLWTGIDLFMALVLGPVLGSLDVDARADVFRRFTPKTTFLLPALATTTIVGGIVLALELNYFPHAGPWLALFTAFSTVPTLALFGWSYGALDDRRWRAAFGLAVVGSAAYLAAELPSFAMTRPIIVAVLAVMVVLTVQGFGVLLPNELRIYREMTSEDPDTALIGELGMRNAKLSGVQGAFQLVIIALMVSLRWGGV
jgi:hypothetical protein